MKTKADIIRDLEGLAGRLGAGDRALVEEIAADLALRHKRNRSEATTERNLAIIAAYRSGKSLREVARQHGITGQRVHQIINSLPSEEVEKLWEDRQASENAKKNAELWRKVEERARTAESCPVCGSWNLRGPKRTTCSKECARIWNSGGARFILDERAYDRRRKAQARSILKNPDGKKPSQITWATKVLTENTPPNRRYHVPGSESAVIAAKVAPEKLPPTREQRLKNGKENDEADLDRPSTVEDDGRIAPVLRSIGEETRDLGGS